MKILLTFALASVASASLFDQYVKQHSKAYGSQEERKRAEKCFLENHQHIQVMNRREPLATFGWNTFTDICPEDFKIRHSLQIDRNRPRRYTNKTFTAQEIAEAAADPVDWRMKGAVTPVKDQGRCGSCWSFSATGNMEGQHFMAANNLVSLSEEELVQCSSSYGNHGCGGGLMDSAFKWVIHNKGIDSEGDYSYTSGGGTTGTCDNTKLGSVVAKFSDFEDMPHDEDQMATWVAKNGPLAIAVDALSWQTYHGGIMSNCNGKQLDHGVLIVGYGTDSGTDYWIVKNSWADTWGEKGYIRLAKGTNQCDLTAMASSIKV